MRRRIFAVVIWCAAAAQAMAFDAVTVREPLVVRAGPGEKYPVVVSAPEGALLKVLRYDALWSRVSVDGRRGYAPTAQVAPSPLPGPSCDYGYPYSGSARFFEGLTELRHGGPLGLLLGTHIQRPC